MLLAELLRPLREPYRADSAGGTAFVDGFQTNHSRHRVAELVKNGADNLLDTTGTAIASSVLSKHDVSAVRVPRRLS